MHGTPDLEQEVIAALVARREREGVSWAELSRASGIAVWRLRYRQRHAKATRPPPTTALVPRSPAHAFVPVVIRERVAAAPPRVMIEIETPAGYRLRVPAEIERESLRRVLDAIAPRC